MLLLLAGQLRAARLIPAYQVTSSAQQYKDSFYFAHGGQLYLAVSDLSLSGVSLLKAVGGSDSHYQFVTNVIPGNHFAPDVIQLGGDQLLFFTTHFAFNESLLYKFRYDIRTGQRGPVEPVGLSGGEKGMTDATVWFQPGRGWYLLGAKWQAGVLGCRLQWSRSDNAQGPYSFPQDLLDQGGVRVDWSRRGPDVNYVVQAPIWSFWDHNQDGNHELYWSIGPSDPKDSSGRCEMWVKAVRRGDILFQGVRPWIRVWGVEGGDGDIMSSNFDCYHLTHPDFTQDGRIRATTVKNNVFVIANVQTF